MRMIGKVALGGSAASAATAGVLLATGVFATSATLVVADPAAPRAAAGAKGLTTFDSCDQLLSWYVDHNVSDVGPYGWNGMVWYTDVVENHAMLADKSVDLAAVPQAGTQLDRTASATGTNTQEAAVDEPDVAKTDGSLVARIIDDKRLVLVDVSGAEPRVTRRLWLPEGGYDNQMLLLDDHLVVTQQVYGKGSAKGLDDTAEYYQRGTVSTRVIDVDISDPTAPRIRSTDTYSGVLLAARQYDDVLRFVTSTSRPELHWVYPGHGIKPAEATHRNRELLRRTTISDWIPTITHAGTTTPLAGCDEVLHPKAYSGDGTVAVTTVPADDLADRSTTAVTASAQIAYSSADRLYIAAPEGIRGELRGPELGGDTIRRYAGSDQRTWLYAFALDGKDTTYVGAGKILGTLRDRWSLDEQDGRLRVAWTTTNDRGSTRSGMTVLAEKDGQLVPTGSVGDLGVDEDLQSVRWFDDVAVLVTYRQTDPLYAIDLRDPDHPVLAGALKIPGYSGYLHPIGDDLLLGLGVGPGSEAQAAVFDITDLRHPVRVSVQSFAGGTGLPALDDPRAFTWDPTNHAGITPLADWSKNTASLVALDVSTSGHLTSRTLAPLNHDGNARTFVLPDGRVAILDTHRVRVVAG